MKSIKKLHLLDPVHPDPAILAEAAKVLQNGGIIAFPTDTFYGLAVNPNDDAAVKRLFKLKRRPPSKPIIILIDQPAKLNDLIKNCDTPLLKKIMENFWPGPLTLVLKEKGHLNKQITGGTETIGIRLPKAAIPIGIIQKTGFPITATSANRSGEPAAMTANEIEKTMGPELDLILDGGKYEGMPSTLLDLSKPIPRILRKGKVSSDQLEPFIEMYPPGEISL